MDKGMSTFQTLFSAGERKRPEYFSISVSCHFQLTFCHTADLMQASTLESKGRLQWR